MWEGSAQTSAVQSDSKQTRPITAGNSLRDWIAVLGRTSTSESNWGDCIGGGGTDILWNQAQEVKGGETQKNARQHTSPPPDCSDFQTDHCGWRELQITC